MLSTRARFFVDAAPAPAGTSGQLVFHDGDDYRTEVIASSIGEYFDDLISCLKRKLIFSDGHAWLSTATGASFSNLKTVRVR
ncbi:hypothetical protein AAW51_4067 [Caldimonas brevitalea]|uniref:Uncharacterized protein n=1 Tax=Caldimonas brevitalea TaxID=413882 RepID=A0A0G3BRY9_9BURK|nr:hypothetical protein AAW51_4067 [Caldimonas brevitalea]